MKTEGEFAYVLLKKERLRMASEIGSNLDLARRGGDVEDTLLLQMMLDRIASLDRAMAILDAW